MRPGPVPFTVGWDRARLADLLDRVRSCPLPEEPRVPAGELGCSRDLLERFRAHWLHRYDVAAGEADLNRHEQYLVDVDGIDVHVVRVRGEHPDSRPLLVSHGWPSAPYEFWRIADRLTHPSAHGGDPATSFDLVLPSLPGYGFSGRPDVPVGPATTADLWDTLMTRELGHASYLAHGGDWGGLVTSQLGLRHPGSVRAIHLTMLGMRSAAPARDAAEREWLARVEASRGLHGYSMLQTTKPLSLAWATAGNPLGQAAWILERYHDWSDLRGTDVETVYGWDRLVTTVLLYAMTDRFDSALWFYNGLAREGGLVVPDGTRCAAPLGYSVFPGDGALPEPPRSRLELVYDVVHWSEHDGGGHFPALERPTALADDLFAWADLVWPVGTPGAVTTP